LVRVAKISTRSDKVRYTDARPILSAFAMTDGSGLDDPMQARNYVGYRQGALFIGF
jgi:hypothetical protein